MLTWLEGEVSIQSQQQATQHEKDKDADHDEDAYLLIVPGVILGERRDGKVTETTEDTWSVTPASNLTKQTEDTGPGPMSYNMAVRGAVLEVFKLLEHHAVSLAVHNTAELWCIGVTDLRHLPLLHWTLFNSACKLKNIFLVVLGVL